MASTRPTIVLVPGLFGTGERYYSGLVPHLEAAGFPIEIAELPSLNPKEPDEVTAQKDVDHVRETYLLPLIGDKNNDLIIVAHLYGGVVAPAAAMGLSKNERVAQGLKGGVIGLILISGVITNEGQSLRAAVGGELAPWLIQDKPRPGVGIMEPQIETMYHDVDSSLEPELTAALTPHGYKCLTTAVSKQCWADKGYVGRLAYIRTTMDRAIPPVGQDAFMEASAVHWDVVDMDTSHAPMVSKPQGLAQHIINLTARFAKVEV